MAEFLTTKGTASEIENIIRKAKKEIFLVSPFLQINKTFTERLEEASDKNIPITIIYGKDELQPRERNSLYKLKTLKLYFFENLHAKCFYNEEKLIITSMNMYSFSEMNNREMGVLIEKVKDHELYKEASDEVQSILRLSDQDYVGNFFENNNLEKNYTDKPRGLGFCIRCEKRIEFNLEKPYCVDCFYVWREFENIYYEENVCHNCGEYNSSTIVKPECWNCFSYD